MFTIFLVFFGKKNRRETIITDRDYVLRQIRKAEEDYQPRVYISGRLSEELKQYLKKEGYRIMEFEYISLKYTSIAR